MSRIGILTFHGSHNYGSVLQAYALSKQLELMGNQAEIINLRNWAQKDAYRIIKTSDKGVRKAFKIVIYPSLKRRYDEYERFINDILPVTNEEYISTAALKNANLQYDTYICGGDQIWNPVCQDFENAYYLEFVNDNSRKISYSPSMGKTEFDEKTLRDIKEWIRKFDYISVREQQGAEILKSLTDKNIEVVCDPVILLNKEYWGQIAIKPKRRKPFILSYFLENNHGDRSLLPYLQKETGYEVVILNEFIRDFLKPYHHAYGASPEEFIGLFMEASFVYTNSFHGTAFSTIFNKPFFTSIAKDQKNSKNNNDSRKIDYLKRIGLEDRLVAGKEDMRRKISIDYTGANRKIEEFRQQSFDYLARALEKN